MVSFKSLLDGPHAFYNMPDYEVTTEKDLASSKALPPSYVWNSESKIRRIAHRIFSILFFPILVYKLLHNLVGKIVVPAATPSLLYQSETSLNCARTRALSDGDWKYKRLTLKVDGSNVDAVIMGKMHTLANGTWTLFSGGNGQFYEHTLTSGSDVKKLLSRIDSNAIVFNYPGVGASEGPPHRQAMANAYRAVLSFLEKEVQAKKIIGYGLSIGGGVQSDALNSHILSDKVKYVFVKQCTFSSLAKEVTCMLSRNIGSLCSTFLAGALHVLGWNMNPLKTSKKLAAREIILQTTSSMFYSPLRDSQDIIDDGVIPKEATYAKALLEEKELPKENKVILGIPEYHNTSLSNKTLEVLAAEINTSL